MALPLPYTASHTGTEIDATVDTVALLGTAAFKNHGVANGVADLDSGGTVPGTQLTYGSSSNTVCQGNDSRLSNSRAPNGSASGDLGGNFPNPTVAQSSTAFALVGQISITVSASLNDWAPTGLSTSNWIRVTQSSISANSITGLTGGAKGRIIVLQVVSIVAGLTLSHQSSSSTAANRFISPTGADMKFIGGESVLLQYDDVQSRWIILGRNVVDFSGDVTSSSGTPKVTTCSINWGLSGTNSPTQITGDQNNYAPTNVATSNMLRLDLDADHHLTGLQSSGGTGQIFALHNISAHNLILDHESGSSSAGNRFNLGGSNLTIPAGCAVMLQKDSTSTRWRVFGAGLYLPLAGGTISGAMTFSSTVGVVGRLTLGPVSNTQSVLTYGASTAIDFDGDPAKQITLTGDITFTTSNKAAGKMVKIRINGDTSLRNFTFPAWNWAGSAPASLAANKKAWLTLECWGTADTDIDAAYVAQS